jgi:hypothetical protein
MQYQYDHMVYANNVTLGEYFLLPWRCEVGVAGVNDVDTVCLCDCPPSKTSGH